MDDGKVIQGVFTVPMVIRGNVITDNLVEFGGRQDDVRFRSPDPKMYVERIPLRSPGDMADLYDLSFEDIVAYLDALGKKLDVRTNPYMAEACECSYKASPLTPPLLDAMYKGIPALFSGDQIREVAENSVGINYLESWVPNKLLNGQEVFIRAFGSRALHVIAGNAPLICVSTVIRNAISRSDGIIKTPSNDPMTAVAIARTMAEMDKNHPITKHLSVAYWKGGDLKIEEQIYQPHNIEKIVAWGGYASVKHVTKYIQPGLELISLDPKRSASIVGADAFATADTIKDVARRIATDVGAMNQQGCVCARIVYVQSGTDDDGIAKLQDLGRQVYDAMLALPEHTSTKAKLFDRDLRAALMSLKLDDDYFEVVGGDDDEGAVIVSKIPEPASFATTLIDRVVNLVPVDHLDQVINAVDAYTQTIGIYPESLKIELRNKLPLFGAQRLVSLGYAMKGSFSLPQDAIEPMRRMCKWIVDERSTPETVPPLWL